MARPVQLGERERFSIEIGPLLAGDATDGIRTVSIWAAARELTCDDDAAYVPQIVAALDAALRGLRSGADRRLPYPQLSPAENHRRLLPDGPETDGDAHRRYRFMDWGPTTDNVLALLFLTGDRATLTFEFWREHHGRPDELGHVFEVELPLHTLLQILTQAADALRRGT